VNKRGGGKVVKSCFLLPLILTFLYGKGAHTKEGGGVRQFIGALLREGSMSWQKRGDPHPGTWRSRWKVQRDDKKKGQTLLVPGDGGKKTDGRLGLGPERAEPARLQKKKGGGHARQLLRASTPADLP